MTQAGRSAEGLLARRLLLLVVMYLAARAAFLAVHLDLFRADGVGEVAWAFVRGLRFDLSAIAYANIPFILLSLAPARLQERAGWQRLLMALFVVGNSACAWVMVADIEYFRFTGTRVTSEVLALRGEALAQADQFLVNYAPFVLLSLAFSGALLLLYPRARGPLRRPPWPRAALAALTIVALAAVATRGGLQKKPLRPIHAFAQGEHELGILALNSVFTLVRSPRDRQVVPVSFFPTDAEAAARLRAPFGFTARPAAPQNVVLIVLESFSNELWGAAGSGSGLTPFLDSLAAEGRFFADNYANGRRSIDALPSFLLGVPHLMQRALARSAYEGNEWVGLGHLLEQAGYHTSFFHGAPKGTMYFDALAALAGIRDFYPLERYPKARQARDFDGHWGLYDEPFLQFAVEELGRHRRPFFTTIFTISTHQPYRVPARYRDSLPEGTAEIHQSVRYVDLAVRRFFEAARRQPWYGETLFILTGDHTPSHRAPRYDTFLGRFLVPLLLVHPGHPLPPMDEARVTQHVDLFPTILDYAGVQPGPVPYHGRSLFSPAPGEAVLHSDGRFWLVRREGVLQRDPDGTERLLAYRREATEPTPVAGDALRRDLATALRAHIQHFANSMVRNAYYRDEPRTHAAAGAR
jgi:arylsulfatase A-like enzyme